MRLRSHLPHVLFGLFLTTAICSTAAAQDEQPKSQPQASPQWRSVIESARPSVVVIRTDTGQGSGFLIKSDGTIATNAHVIAGSSTIEVKLSTGEIYRRVYVLASDEGEDIALLRIEGIDLPSLSLGNSNDAKVGDDVILVGAPLGLEETISTGIVSAIRVSESGLRVIQTTAAASPGSSGGPLLNAKGEVLGLMSFGATKGQNLNFVIPINYIRGKLNTLPLSGNAQLMDSSGKPLSNNLTSSAKHSGVIVTGLSGPGTPSGSFQYLLVELLDYLSAKSVELMNETTTVKSSSEGTPLPSLNYYLERLPASGASGLVYMLVERPYNGGQGGYMTFKYTVRLQCFDHSGKLLWEEKESHSALSETGATNGVLKALEKKLEKHIGNPGLPMKQEKVEANKSH